MINVSFFFAPDRAARGSARVAPQVRAQRAATHRGRQPEPHAARFHRYDDAVSPMLLRVSVGLEEVEHLQRDLERAILEVTGR